MVCFSVDQTSLRESLVVPNHRTRVQDPHSSHGFYVIPYEKTPTCGPDVSPPMVFRQPNLRFMKVLSIGVTFGEVGTVLKVQNSHHV